MSIKLSYPSMKADIDLCYKQLYELCNGNHDKAVMSVPPRETDFDIQMSAAFDELNAYRMALTSSDGVSPDEVSEKLKQFSLLESSNKILNDAHHRVCNENAVLRKALELESDEIASDRPRCQAEGTLHCNTFHSCNDCVTNEFIQQAKEALQK